MPQVATSANLAFTNHWIGIYDPRAPKLIPTKRVVEELQPALASRESADGIVVPADPATLVRIYEQAIVERERPAEPNSATVAHAIASSGSFLLQIGKDN